MPETVQVKFGRKDEPATALEKSGDLLVVRTRSTRSIMAGPVLAPAAAAVEDGEMVLSFPQAGVEVYRVPTARGARTVAARKETLRMAPDVRFAGGALIEPETGEPVVYTENLFVKFTDDADPDQCREVIRAAGLTIKREVDYAPNAYFAAAPEGTGTAVFDIATRLLARDDVEYCHPEVLRERRFKAVAPEQWHLKTTTVGATPVSASANVEAAHAVTLGAGVTIAVIDDGVDVAHPEFSTAGKVVFPRDATMGTNDPRPKDPDPRFPDNHGTACAGVACADGRSGASGVAPGARLMPIRLASGLGSMEEGDAFRWAADHGADVISCSWGPPDGQWFNPTDPRHNSRFPIPASTRLAIDYVTNQGRGGRGCVVLFAAGNGRESVDNDGYASYERVIAVAACNDRGKQSVYSDFGNAVWCAFPSSDFGFVDFNQPSPLTAGIWTTDRVGTAGYNRGRTELGDAAGNFTNSFGGTSSSCPGAAGVAALVLSVNPALRWQQVRDVLRDSCDRIDPDGGEYDANGRSKKYGHGRLNAATAVRLAAPAPRNAVTVSRDFNQPLPDLQEVSVSLEVGEADPVAAVSVQVDILHTYIGDLIVTLIPPAGLNAAAVPLHVRGGGSTRNLKRTFDVLTTPALGRFGGKSAKGTWALKVEDRAVRDEGTLVRFGLELTFPPPGRLPDAGGASPNGAPRARGAARARVSGGARAAPAPKHVRSARSPG